MGTSARLYALMLGLSLCLLLSCKKENDTNSSGNCIIQDNRTCVGYLETYCSDSWGQGYTNDEPLITELIDFLGVRDIELTQIYIEVTSSPEYVMLVVAKTGRTIYGSVANEDLDAIKELRFFEQ